MRRTVLVLGLSMLSCWAQVPDNPSVPPAPAQPLPYSHKKHLAMGLQCAQCHINPDPGAQMTFPASTTCIMCHNTAEVSDRGRIAELAKSSQPIPWVRVYQVTPGVTWTHRKHLQAGMQCAMCHGNVAQMDAMAQTTAVLAMASCITCHQSHKASTACATCHAWPAPS